jgi:hypothetical protein
MPDAKCDLCNKTLGTICKGPVEIQRFKNLVDASCLKIMGQITGITSIHHNEIDTNSKCIGVMLNLPFSPTPTNVVWGS